MPKYTESRLKLEIESHLNACGLFETLGVFRKECSIKLGSCSGEETQLKTEKSTLAKSYFENGSEVFKTGQRADGTQNEPTTSAKESNRNLPVKMCELREICLRHILLNLELVTFIKSNLLFPNSPNNPSNSNSASMSEDAEELLEKRESWRCRAQDARKMDEKGSSVRLSFFSLNTPDDLSPISNPGSSRHTHSNSDISSAFQIIHNLRNISPLVSDISLASFRDDRNLMAVQSNRDSFCHFKNFMQFEDQKKVAKSAHGRDFHFFREQQVDSGSISSLSNCCQNELVKNCEEIDLPRWCKEFLKIPNSPSCGNRHHFDTDMCSFVSSNSEYFDCANLETNYTGSSFTEGIIDGFAPPSSDFIAVVSTRSRKGAAEPQSSFDLAKDLEFLEGSFCNQNRRNHPSKCKGVAVEHLGNNLKLFNDKSDMQSPFEQAIYNDQRFVKKCFSDTYLQKTEKQMADMVNYNTMPDLKTPFMRNKLRICEFAISNNNQKHASNCDLGVNRVIQNKSRFMVSSVEKSLFPEEDCFSCSGGDEHHPDRGKDTARKEEEPSNNNDDHHDLNLFSTQSEKSFYVDSLTSLNSAASNKGDVRKLRTVHDDTSFGGSNKVCDSVSLDSLSYLEFKDYLKPVRSSSIVEIPKTQNWDMSKCESDVLNQFADSCPLNPASNFSQQSRHSLNSSNFRSSKSDFYSNGLNSFTCSSQFSPAKDLKPVQSSSVVDIPKIQNGYMRHCNSDLINQFSDSCPLNPPGDFSEQSHHFANSNNFRSSKCDIYSDGLNSFASSPQFSPAKELKPVQSSSSVDIHKMQNGNMRHCNSDLINHFADSCPLAPPSDFSEKSHHFANSNNFRSIKCDIYSDDLNSFASLSQLRPAIDLKPVQSSSSVAIPKIQNGNMRHCNSDLINQCADSCPLNPPGDFSEQSHHFANSNNFRSNKCDIYSDGLNIFASSPQFCSAKDYHQQNHHMAKINNTKSTSENNFRPSKNAVENSTSELVDSGLVTKSKSLDLSKLNADCDKVTNWLALGDSQNPFADLMPSPTTTAQACTRCRNAISDDTSLQNVEKHSILHSKCSRKTSDAGLIEIKNPGSSTENIPRFCNLAKRKNRRRKLMAHQKLC